MAALSNAEDVREFTAGAGQPTPDTPQPMTEAEVDFIGKMILDEVMELFATRYTPEVAKEKLRGFIDNGMEILQTGMGQPREGRSERRVYCRPGFPSEIALTESPRISQLDDG